MSEKSKKARKQRASSVKSNLRRQMQVSKPDALSLALNSDDDSKKVVVKRVSKRKGVKK
jgi:hypothetical protein